MLRKRQKGFTLIELLIVVAIIAIIAAIAIPNLLTALQKGRQKRTMGDMKTIANGLESYDVDIGMYPNDTFANLANYLSPFYIASFPRRDGWNNLFVYQTASPFDVYSLISYGRDRAPGGGQTGSLVYGQYFVVQRMSDFDTDIYLSNGQFTWAPKQ